jgi:hypothetical protein
LPASIAPELPALIRRAREHLASGPGYR